MYFIGDDHDTIILADVAKTRELFHRPFATDRIVRVAEDEQLGSRLGGETLKVGKVDFEMAVIIDERVALQCSSVTFHHVEKRRIDRWLDDDSVARRGERLDRDRESRDYAWTPFDPSGVDIPMVAVFLPLLDGLCETWCTESVAIDSLLHAFAKRHDDRGRTREVHVGDPERDEVASAEDSRT